MEHRELILETLFIDIKDDNPQIHPNKCCHKCYCTLKNSSNRKSKPSINLFAWTEHNDTCITCSKKGGELKFIKKGRSLKTDTWTREVILQNLEWEKQPKFIAELFKNYH